MKPLTATVCLVLASHLLALAAGADDLTVARSLQSSLGRTASHVMVRVVERPERASLDVAAWDRNPIFHYPMPAPPAAH